LTGQSFRVGRRGALYRDASRQLVPELRQADPSVDPERVQDVLEDPDSSKKVALAVLGEVRKYPELAQAVAVAYEDRLNKMPIGAAILLSAALVVLAVKIKSIEWGKDKKKLTFYESSEAVKAFLTGLLKYG
jgi:hypothetical protein